MEICRTPNQKKTIMKKLETLSEKFLESFNDFKLDDLEGIKGGDITGYSGGHIVDYGGPSELFCWSDTQDSSGHIVHYDCSCLQC